MERAAARMPPNTGLNGLLLSAKIIILEGPEYENTTLYPCMGESLARYKDIIIIIIGFLINVQVQGHHPHQWAPFQVTG